MSREHVMPQWMGGLFPDLTEVDYVRAFGTASGEYDEHTRSGRPFDQTVKDFCIQCNTGWMSRLEVAAAPILGPLIQGESRSLTALDQEMVAIWAIKTVLTAGPTNLGGEPFASEETYRWFGANQIPLPGSLVWIGRYAGGDQWPISFHLHGMAFGPADEQGRPIGEMFEGFHAVFAIGHLVLCVFQIEHRDPLASGGSDLQRKLIWPTRGDSVWWPPAHPYRSTDELQEASRLTPGGPAAPLPEGGAPNG
jgi:hypothetical protein